MSKSQTLQTIVEDFLFESTDDLRKVLARKYPNSRIEITNRSRTWVVSVDDVSCSVVAIARKAKRNVSLPDAVEIQLKQAAAEKFGY
jgi:hypothetical protein